MTRSTLSIALFSPLFHPVIGGSESYTWTLAEGLARRGHRVLVVTDRTDASLVVCEEMSGFTVLRLGRYRECMSSAGSVSWECIGFGLVEEVVERLDGRPIDVLHAQNQCSLLPSLMFGLERGVPTVLTMHEQAPEDLPGGRGRSRLLLGHLPFTFLIAGSRFYADQGTRLGCPAEKLKIVYHGIDVEKFGSGDGTVERAALVSDGEPLVVLPGRFTPRKGLLDFVEAMAIVRERVPRVRACLAGAVSSTSPEYLQSVRARISDLHLDETVVIADGVYGVDTMPNLFAAADLVVQPSYAEGLGLAVIEAMVAGTPVVVTDIPGLDELVADGVNGRVVSAGDAMSLAGGIISALVEPAETARMASAAKATAATRFNRDRMLDEIVVAYGEAVQGCDR